jgi:integrase
MTKLLPMKYKNDHSNHFSIQDIREDPQFQKFISKKKGRNPKTLENYVKTFKLFSNFTKKSPYEIYLQHKTDLKNRTPEFEMWLTDAIDEFVSELIERGQSYYTIQGNVSRVLAFLHTFRLRPTPQVEINKKRVSEDAKYALKRRDIQKAVKDSPLTYQVIFITQAQTGLSISDVLLLDVEDFISAVAKRGENLSVIEDLTLDEAIRRVETDDNVIGCFDLRRKKTNNEFYTFAGPEVLKNIAYLIKMNGDRFKTPESPIFIKDVSKIPNKYRNTLKRVEDYRLNVDVTENYVSRLNKKSFYHIEVDGKKRNFFRTHKLRKWFSNQLRFEAKFTTEDTKYLMGQKTGDVLEHYIDPNNYISLKNNYRKALPFLAINLPIHMEENLELREKDQERLKVVEQTLRDLRQELMNK